MFAFGDASKKNRVRGVPRRYELPRYQQSVRSWDALRIPGGIRADGSRNPLKLMMLQPGDPGNELEGLPVMPPGYQPEPTPTTPVNEPPFTVTIPGFTGKSKGGVKAY